MRRLVLLASSLSIAAAVVFGSMNWTGAGDADNDENTLYVKNDGFADAFHAEFEREWADLGAVRVSCLFHLFACLT